MRPAGCGIAAGPTSSGSRDAWRQGDRKTTTRAGAACSNSRWRSRGRRPSAVLPAARLPRSRRKPHRPSPIRTRRSAAALSRIAFGCCADQDKPQPVWDPVLARQNDLFIFLGDNIYADTRDMAAMRRKYAKLAAIRAFARLRETTPLVAIWDDHDFGENDAGGDYPMKEESRRIFLDFWAEPAASPRRDRDGIYASYVFGPAGARVQVILPDLRFNRTAMTPMALAGRRLRGLGAQARRRRPAAARPLRAQSRSRGDDARRAAVAVARAAIRRAGGAAPVRLERAGARRRHGLGGLGELRARPGPAVRRDSAQARERRAVPLGRHPLRGAQQARRQRALSALGPDVERTHGGMARPDAQRESRERGRSPTPTSAGSTSTGRAKRRRSRSASPTRPAGSDCPSSCRSPSSPSAHERPAGTRRALRPRRHAGRQRSPHRHRHPRGRRTPRRRRLRAAAHRDARPHLGLRRGRSWSRRAESLPTRRRSPTNCSPTGSRSPPTSRPFPARRQSLREAAHSLKLGVVSSSPRAVIDQFIAKIGIADS